MRLLVLYSLIVFFIWQIVGFGVGFEIAHTKIKKEVKLLLKKGVPKEDRLFFNFTKEEMANLIWVKKNEFILDGSYFDVIERHENKIGFTLECISDKQETILFSQLEDIVNANLDDHNNDGLMAIIKKFNTNYLNTQRIGIIVSGVIDPSETLCNVPYKRNSMYGYLKIEIAPPEA